MRLTTNINVCIGIHHTGNPIFKMRTFITDLGPDWEECSDAEKDAVLAAGHAYLVAEAEAVSRFNATGRDGEAIVQAELSAERPIHGFFSLEDALFRVASEDAETFCRIYAEATKIMNGLGQTPLPLCGALKVEEKTT